MIRKVSKGAKTHSQTTDISWNRELERDTRKTNKAKLSLTHQDDCKTRMDTK